MSKKNNELTITRVYDAPVKAVWEAWTDTKQVAQWWGPRGYSITTHSKDFRPGGIWHYTMHGPDGTDYPNKTLYHVIEKHALLEYDHGGYDDRPPLFRVRVTFEEINQQTKMMMTMAFASADVAKEMKKFIKTAGGNGTWDRLAEYLEKNSSGQEKFVINRTLEAPIETVFDMWTNPKHFNHWMGPTGSTMEYIRCDIKVGGSMFYSMTSSDGTKLYGTINYKEIQKPQRIVYTQDFRDKDENIARHPLATLWPETMLTTVTLCSEGPQETRITVEWTPYKSTPEETAAFVQARSGMTQGWTGSFDKLEEYLSK